MTLDDMINECLVYTDNALSTKSKYQSRFISSINYAKNKIAKERYAPEYQETVILDANQRFSLASLTKRFLRLISVTSSDGYGVPWYADALRTIKCPTINPNTSVMVIYQYIPADLVNTSDILDFTESIIDPKLLCKFAAYEFLVQEGGSTDLQKASYWLSLWNDGFNAINTNIGTVNNVLSIYGGDMQ